MTNSWWVTLHISWWEIWLYLILWPTGCEWHCTFFWKAMWLYLVLWTPVCECHCTLLCKGNLILSYDQQDSGVGDNQHFPKNLTHCHISSMTNRMWVTLHIMLQGNLTIFCPMTNRMWVTQTLHTFLKSSLIASFCMTNRKWVTLCNFLGNLISCCSMTNRKWVTLHTFWTGNLITSCPWLTGCGWDYTFSARQSDHILSYDQKDVSDIAHCSERQSEVTPCPMDISLWVTLHTFMKGYLISSCPMTNRKWVTFMHMFWKEISSHLVLRWTESEWCCTAFFWMAISPYLVLWTSVCE